ncbi:putative ribonuclease H-like domain-containing protein, partial [Tanacetum coccineum]
VKIEHQRASGLLQPLEIPVWKWDEISMDFVTGLPTTQKRHDAIWVVVDRLTKSAHFLPIRKNYGIIQVYVDDIIFASTRKEMCTEFEKLMHKKFQMSSMGELTFFLGHQVTQTASTPMETLKPLLKDAEAEDVDVHLYRSMIGSLMYLTSLRPDIMTYHFDLEAYTDSDYDGASLDRKSTTEGCQFLRKRLISWQCKKQTVVANSTTEAKYVVVSSCCGQVLWIQNQMHDYGYNFMNTKIFIDNESTIYIVKNPVFHSKTKHIEIRHHFIRDSNEKKLIQMIKIHTDHNVADLLRKAFDVSRFQYLIARCLEWNGTAAKDEIQVSAVRVTYYCGPIPLVADESVIKEWEDRMEKDATTASSLAAEQDSGSGPRCQDTIFGGAEAQIRFEAASKQSNDPPLSRVNKLGNGEDSMKLKELMELCIKLPERALDLA